MKWQSEISGHFTAPTRNIAIVASRFNEALVEGLMRGAKDMLLRHGVTEDHIDVFRVPGAYEIPLACQQVAKTNRYAGIISLGVVIRGETKHFEYVAGACAQGVLQAQLNCQIPIAFGVITTENIEQAIARAGTTAGNKGGEAAMCLLEMINLLDKING